MPENQTIHVKNIEKYHPKYKDRHLIWCKVYFTMLDGDPEFEMIDEIDKWRFIAFVILELKAKNPIPLDDKYLSRKGFDLKKRPISKTLQALHVFIEVRNKMLQNVTNPVTYNRVDYNRVDYNRVDKSILKEKHLDLVLLTKEEYQNLIDKFGEEGTKTRLESLNSYGYQKPKKFKEYGSHYHTILAWENKNEQQSTQGVSQKDAKGKKDQYTGLNEKDYHDGSF